MNVVKSRDFFDLASVLGSAILLACHPVWLSHTEIPSLSRVIAWPFPLEMPLEDTHAVTMAVLNGKKCEEK